MKLKHCVRQCKAFQDGKVRLLIFDQVFMIDGKASKQYTILNKARPNTEEVKVFSFPMH